MISEEKEKTNYVLRDAKLEFKKILKKYVLQFFSGKCTIKIYDNKTSNKVDALICKADKVNYNVYPTTGKPAFFARVKNADISDNDRKLANTILLELSYVNEFNCVRGNVYKRYNYDARYFVTYNDKISGKVKKVEKNIYKDKRYKTAFEVGISKWLGGVTIVKLIDELSRWSTRTYEGNKVPFGFLVNIKNDKTKYNMEGLIDFIEYLSTDTSGALFTDGMSSGLKLDYQGKVINYFTVKKQFLDKKPYTPISYSGFASMCREDEYKNNWVGIVLMKNGTIMIIKNQELILTKKNNKWYFVKSHLMKEIIFNFIKNSSALTDRSNINKMAEKLALLILDISYLRKGGCIGIVTDEMKNTLTDKYCNNDYLKNQNTKFKHLFIKSVTNYDEHKFLDIDRNLLQDLLSMDGALVMDANGSLICAGAIIKVDGGSDEGGRTAAAKQLGKFGLGIKISEDGNFSFYKKNVKNKVGYELVYESLK